MHVNYNRHAVYEVWSTSSCFLRARFLYKGSSNKYISINKIKKKHTEI